MRSEFGSANVSWLYIAEKVVRDACRRFELGYADREHGRCPTSNSPPSISVLHLAPGFTSPLGFYLRVVPERKESQKPRRKASPTSRENERPEAIRRSLPSPSDGAPAHQNMTSAPCSISAPIGTYGTMLTFSGWGCIRYLRRKLKKRAGTVQIQHVHWQQLADCAMLFGLESIAIAKLL
jgi:hypothetical protein